MTDKKVQWRNRITGSGELPTSSFLANEGNWRIHPKNQQDGLGGVLGSIGWVQDVIVNRRTSEEWGADRGVETLVDGHLRVTLALRQGDDTPVPVKYVDLTPAEEATVLATLDPIAAMAASDRDKLDSLMRQVQSDDERVQALMADIAKREGLDYGAPPADDPGAQIDRAEELRLKWGVEPGQLWQLGEHRLICGDCTDRAVVERVMGGEKARMIFTDPPYGVGKDFENDNLKREKLTEFYRAFTGVMLDFVIVNAYVYVWGYFDTLSDYWQEVVKPRGDCNFRNFIVWQKKNVQGRTAEDYRQFPEEYEAALLCIFGQPFQNGPWSTSPNSEYYPEMFEPIRAYLDGERVKMGWDIPTCKKIAGHSDLSRDHWFGRSQWTIPTREVYEKFQASAGNDAFRKDYDELRRDYDELRGYFDNSHGFTDLWRLPDESRSNAHPTSKPVELCERGIITTSREGEIILDTFSGSGTTLIACEQLGRKCRAVEISPAYVAVALERWSQLTGQQPRRVE